jgi:hypothetical protein
MGISWQASNALLSVKDSTETLHPLDALLPLERGFGTSIVSSYVHRSSFLTG